MSLTVSQEYASLLPKLSEIEYNLLKLSIQTNDLFLPIVTNSKGVVLDGHHRLRACEELGIEPKYETRNFSTMELEREFVIRVNLERRHLNDFQKAELGLLLLPLEEEKAKQREVELGSTFGLPVGSNEPTGKARDIVSEIVGLSPTTFERAKTILEKGSNKLKQEVREGRKSIFSAYQQLQRETPKEYPSLPEGQFDIVYADPPWQYDFSLSDMGDPESFYPTLSTEEICKLPISSADNSILFLWATNPKLEDALRVIRAWGFEYKTNMVWIKSRWGNGYYFRGQHELLLVAKKGKPTLPKEADRPSSVLEADWKGHSQKPDIVYEIIEKLFPNSRYLELFARKERPNWVAWGNQI